MSLNLGQYQETASETFLGPMSFTLVIFRDGWNARRKLNPWLLRGSENVYIGRQVIRRVKRADPNEPDDGARTRIVAPYGHLAFLAARNLLSLAAVRRRADDLRLHAQMNHVIRLDHGVQRERRAALSLAPMTMAAMDKQRLFDHTIADNSANAASVEWKDIPDAHICDAGLG